MRRTILGLFVERPTETIESWHGDDGSIQVEDVQEDLSGRRIVSGEAANIGTEEQELPEIADDGSIHMVDRSVEDRTHVDWFADAESGFVAVDSSDGEFVFNGLGLTTGGWVMPASYDLEAFASYLLNEEDADLWQVSWSEPTEAGAFFPGPGSDESITEHGLRSELAQVGFTFRHDTSRIRGTCAASGYLELYSPDYETEEMAQFIRNTMLQFAFVDSDAAHFHSDAGDDVDVEVCQRCERESESVGEDGHCIVCRDRLEEAQEDDAAGETTTFDDLDSVSMAGGSDE